MVDTNKNTSFDDGSVLVNLYSALVQGVLEAIANVSKDYRNLKADFMNGIIFGKVKQVS